MQIPFNHFPISSQWETFVAIAMKPLKLHEQINKVSKMSFNEDTALFQQTLFNYFGDVIKSFPSKKLTTAMV